MPTPTPLHAGPSVRSTLAGQRLLVTGVTGFLGKVWLAHTLQHVPDLRLTLLVRPAGHASALDRFAHEVDTSPVFRQLRALHGGQLGAWLAQRVFVLDGELTQPHCGLDATTRAQLADQIDAVVHFAGLTDFSPDPLKALGANVEGARHVAELAASTASRRMLHVSTTYVAGVGSRTVEEALEPLTPAGQPLDPVAELAQITEQLRGTRAIARVAAVHDRANALGWPNIYTYTKALAERLLAARDDLDLTIVRPSIVECAVDFPFAGWNEGLNTSGPLSWLIASLFRELPSHAEHRFDIVPVDQVARGVTVVLAAALRGQAQAVYQLASSDHNPLSFGRTIELNGLALRKRVRTHGGSAFDSLVRRHLDPVPLPLDRARPWSVPNLRKGLGWAKRQLSKIEAPALLAEPLDSLSAATADAYRQLRRVEQMLELYRPFIHDNDWCFRTDHVRQLCAALPQDEQALFGWTLGQLDWRRYWVDIEYPGLCTWSIPILYGEDVPRDPPSGLQIGATQALRRSAK